MRETAKKSGAAIQSSGAGSNSGPPGRRGFCASEKGTTLLEIIVVVVLVGILAAIAIPSMRALAPRYRLQSATSELVEAMQLGRMRAISTGRVFYIDFDYGGDGINGKYYVCYLDGDGDAVATLGEVAASQVTPNDQVHGVGVIRLPKSVSYGAVGSTPAPNSDPIGVDGVAVDVNGTKRLAFRPDGRIALNNSGKQPTIYLQADQGRNRAVQVNLLGRIRVLKWGNGGWD